MKRRLSEAGQELKERVWKEMSCKWYYSWRGVLGTLFCSLKKGTNTDCTEYIRKDLLLEWAKEQSASCNSSVAMKRAYDKLIDKLKSI